MKIGADELILWLRKNEAAVNIGNEDLGKKIKKLICAELGGEKLEEECYWVTETKSQNVGKYELPQSARQYELDVDKVSSLYQEIMTW